MKQIWKKLGSVFLALCLIVTLLPTVAFAADASTLASTIEAYSGGTGKLSASVSDSTVTVTGTVTDASSTLTLNIDSGVTVIWRASITAAADFTKYLLAPNREGTLEVAESGTVLSTNSSAISNSSTGGVTVSGGTVSSGNFAIYNSSTGGVTVSGGTVESTGSGGAIYNTSMGVITVSGNATVKNQSSTSSTIQQENAGTDTADRIIIEGGTVENTGTAYAIYTPSSGGVRVSGGTVSSAGFCAISNSSTGRVTVSGGTVENTGTGIAIYNSSTGVIRVSGDATVQTGAEATIKQENAGTDTAARIVIEGGTVKNTGAGCAIYNASVGEITISGGNVSASTGCAIYSSKGIVRVSGTATVQNSGFGSSYPTILQAGSAEGTADRIIVEGGTVENSGTGICYAIYNTSTGGIKVSGGLVSSYSRAIISEESGGVTVSGGTVESVGGAAIETYKAGTVTVSGGIVRATTKEAIVSNDITVSGGVVFAYGTDIIGDNQVIYQLSPVTTFTGPTETGVVIAWNQGAGTPTYDGGDSTGLIVLPGGASATWDRSGDQSGISYANGSNTGFFAVDGVTVVFAPKPADFTAPDSLTYDGTAKAYTKPSDMDATIYYEGIDPTTYTSSDTAPTDVGAYKVTANVTENDAYCAATGLEIGMMTITPKTITESMFGEISAQSYTGQKITPPVTVTDGTALTKDTDYTVSYSELATVTDGGTVTVTGMGNYTGGVTKNFTVSPLTLTITAATVEPKTYDGTTTATVTGVTLSSDVDSMVMGTDFTAAGTFDDKNAGSGRSVTITVTLGNTDKAKNYNVSGNYTLANQTIAKCTAPTASDDAISHRNTVTGEKTLSIAALVPAYVGTASFAAGSEADSSNIIGDWSVNTSGTVTYTLNGGAAGGTATLPINVSTENYQDFTINVVITLTDKDVPLVSVDSISAAYGDALVIRGSAIVDSITVAGTWSFVSDTSSLTIGPNSVTVQFTPTNSDTYAEVTHVITVTLSKATPTGEPKYTKITENEKTLADAVLTTEGGTFSVPGTVAWVLTSTTAVQKNTAYAWLFTPTDNTHYNTLSGSTTLYPYSSGGDNSGGSSSGGSSSTTPAPTVSGSTATTTATAKTGSDGKAAASVTQSQVTSAIEKAQKAAKSNGTAPKVEIQVSGASSASTTETTLPRDAVQAMVSGKMESLTLSGPVAEMTFDAQAIASIAGAASGEVKFSASKVETSTLPDAVRQVVGDHPVYNFSITSGSSTISQFGGTVTVSVPYTPAAGENVNAIVAYYINADSEPELMQNCHYDAKTGTLVFTTTHFSTYAVGYHKVVFSDVAEDAWCYEAVTFLAARGITGGTTETAFSPNATLSRGQFITMVMRAYGIEPDNSSANNFSDAGNTYYTGYLAAAKRLGITNGVGGNKFAPKQAVSRQQMFALLYNALKAIDQLPEGDSGKTLSDFTDSESISSYAQEAMAYLVETGVIGGNNGLLSPTVTTTRAQMAQVLYNLLSMQ